MIIDDGKVHSTTDYKIFKKHEQNRPEDAGNLRKLEASIKFKNLLSFRPILVNPKGEVIDGQHRLKVAEMLGVEIFYTVQQEAKVEDIIILNETQKRWGLEDYANFHYKAGNINYQKLFYFCKENKIPLIQGINFICVDRNSSKSDSFKRGNWVFPETHIIKEKENLLNMVNEVAFLIDRKSLGNKRYLSSVTFKKSLCRFLDNQEINFESFTKKVEAKIELFRGCARIMDYMAIFKAVYNYRNQNPID